MAVHNILFGSTDGGVNGSNAIVNNSAEFYVDLGKFSSYETLTLSDTNAGDTLTDYGSVTGLQVVIEDAYGSPETTVDVALYHTPDDGWTDAIEVNPADAEDDKQNIFVGDEDNIWGKTWGTEDINEISIKIFNPQEPEGGIALRGTFVYLIVTYTPTTDIPSIRQYLQLSSGLIKLGEGSGKTIIS